MFSSSSRDSTHISPPCYGSLCNNLAAGPHPDPCHGRGPPAITKSSELKRSPPLLKRTPELVLPLIYNCACICYLIHLSFSHFSSATRRARTLQRDRCLGHASVDQLASPLKRDIESPISFAFKARLELLVVAATLDKIGARPCR